MSFEFIDIVLYVVYLVSALSLVAIVWSNVRHVTKGGRSQKVVNRVPVRKITLCVFAVLFVVIALTAVLASSLPVKVAGELYKDVLWLKMADICFFTLATMLVAGLASVLFSIIKGRIR